MIFVGEVERSLLVGQRDIDALVAVRREPFDRGAERVIEFETNDEEKAMFAKSVESVQGLMDVCKTIDPSLV